MSHLNLKWSISGKLVETLQLLSLNYLENLKTLRKCSVLNKSALKIEVPEKLIGTIHTNHAIVTESHKISANSTKLSLICVTALQRLLGNSINSSATTICAKNYGKKITARQKSFLICTKLSFYPHKKNFYINIKVFPGSK